VTDQAVPNAGNDAGGIPTYAGARAKFGYRTLFLMVLVTVARVVEGGDDQVEVRLDQLVQEPHAEEEPRREGRRRARPRSWPR
jgi:hypothetical protein